ncbi:signal peptidase I [Quadrisphaera sp. DSM 44207]|uniref:signal peptidase I n=1 Tax=Quadrisphaera sp. DSM 44207 TaxID=1881057 RepID=UPI00088090CD|nr:signal peptidase I [Quadrisphaera sp. DSM 44207]
MVRATLLGVFAVPSGSMEPTLRPGDRVLVWRPADDLASIARGDLVVFDGTGSFDPWVDRGPLGSAWAGLAGSLGLPGGPPGYVKRVVGLPGERVACCDGQGRLVVDGEPLQEPYLAGGGPASRTAFDVVVPPGRLWVLGDARDASADSRAHLGDPGGGTVPVERLVGRVVAVAWPLHRATLLDAQDSAPGRNAP